MVKLKTKEDIQVLREGGKILSGILAELEKMVEPGVSTEDLEKRAIKLIKEAGGQPSFKGYKNNRGRGDAPQSRNTSGRGRRIAPTFPTALCTCLNEEIVHAPSLPTRYLKNGDIISLDVGMKYKKLFTDIAVTLPVGTVDEQAERLIEVAQQCLELAINQIKPGNKLFDIAQVIQNNAEANGFGVVRELVGHGVGYDVHEEPQVPNFINEEKDIINIKLEPGLVIALEPMVTAGDWHIKAGKDGFTILTKDGSLSAHFEHTVAVVENGCVVITSVED